MISNKGSRLVSVNAVHTKLVSETSKALIGAYTSTCCILIGAYTSTCCILIGAYTSTCCILIGAYTSTCCILIGAAIGRFNGMTRCFNVFMSLRKRLTGSTVKLRQRRNSRHNCDVIYVIQLYCNKRKEDGVKFGQI